MNRNTKLLLGSTFLAAAFSLAPVRADLAQGARGLTTSEACAQAQPEVTPQTGTCCLERDAICVVGTVSHRDYYYKSEGSCRIIYG